MAEFTAVKVTGFPKDIDPEHVKLYFESKTSSGGEIEDFKWDSISQEAVVVYSNSETAERVLRNTSLQMKDSPLTVTPVTHEYSETDDEDENTEEETSEPFNPDVATEFTAVKVTGFPKDIDPEYVKLYFESKTRSGGGEIEDFNWDSISKEAVIVYTNSETADRVLRNTSLQMKDQPLTVTPVTHEYSETDDEDENTEGEMSESFNPDVATEFPAVKVAGFPKNIDPEYVKLFFESKTSSGGGEIKDFYWNKITKEASIVYFSSEAAERVLTNTTLGIKGFPLTATPITAVPADKSRERSGRDSMVARVKTNIASTKSRRPPLRHRYSTNIKGTPEIGDNTIEVRGFKPGTAKDALLYFFENKRRNKGGDVEKIIVSPDGKLARITFFDKEVAERMVQNKDLQLEGARLWISHPKHSEIGAITVRGIPKDMPAERLEDIFENQRRSGGGPIKHLNYDRNSQTAHITFEKLEDAESVLQKGSLDISGARLEISPAENTDPQTAFQVLVTDLPDNTTKETLTFFFENPKRGGGDIRNIDLDPETMTAVVTFMDDEVAQHFIQQKELYMIDTCIKVCQVPSSGVQPNVSKAFAKDRRTSHVHNRHVHMDVPSSCAVTVEGVSKRTSEQFLIMHFENRLRTGGGKIRDIYRGPSETGIYTITFEEPEVARRVFQKRHSLDDHILEVHQLPSAKMELDNKPVKTDLALVYDIPDHIDSYHLLRHFEELTKCHIKEITYGLNPSLALLEFGEPIDFLSLAHHCIKYPLFGAMLGVEPVPTSLSVQVFGIDNIYNDPLEMYFESNKHSGGCEEVKVELQKEHGCAIVRCPSTKVLKEILSRNHELSGQTLKVDTYYSCLGPLPPGLDRHSPIRIPKGAFVPLPGKEEGDFLRKSATARQQMDMVLKKLHGSVTWDDPDSSEDHLYIHCTLRNNDQKALSLAQNWEKNVRSAANSFLANLCSQSKDVLQEIWPKLREYIDHSRFTQEQIKLGLDDKTCRLTITGFRDKVTHVFDDLNEKIKILQDEMDRAAQTICEKVHLKAIECQLLLGMKSQEKLVQNWPGLNIEINIETENVAFEGVLKDVLNAKAEMLQLIHSMPSEKYKVNDKRMRLLSQKETHDYISEQLHQQNIVAVWEIDEDDLIIQSQNPKDNRRVLGIINSEIDSIQFDIPEASRPILTSDTWYKLKADVQSDKQGLVIVETNSDNSVLEIVGKNTLVHGLLENVRSFFDENTILEEMVALQLGFVEVIVRYMGDNIHAIEKDFASCAVGISTTKSKDGFQIKGNKDGLVQAKKRLLKLAESVVFRQHEIIHPGMPKYFRSRGGRTNLNSLQTEYSVMIYTDADKPFETPNTPLQATGPQEICRVKHPNGPLIIVFVDDMPSHACDVIVNPANGDLKHAGGLARALSDKGGPEIQRQSDEYVQRKGKVQEGCVAVTGAGKLPCKKLIHAVGPKYNGGYKNEENLLYEVTWACLETAETPRVSSIAIPAISTGVFAFPLQKACQTIVEAIKEYFQNPKYHTLREIHLVDNEMQTAQALRTAVEQAYGMSPKVQGASAARPRHANIPRDIPDPVDPSEYLHIHSVRAASPVKEDDNQLSATAASPVKEHDNQLRTNEGVTITLIDGEIGCQEVDVIVNTCSQNFNLNQGAVSNALLLAAGPGLQAEVKKQVPEGVKHGQIVATSGHKLPCSQVYHGSCPNWNGGAGNSEEILRNFVKGTLIKANLDGHSSIALPAIGTGNLQYPRDFVAHAMFEEAKEFSKTTRDLSLTDIFFVVYGRNDQPTVQAFNAEMKKQGGGASLAGAGRTPKKTHRSSTAAEDIGNRAWRSSRSEVRKILEEDEEEMYGDVDILEQGQQQMKIGSIVLQVQLGDLTHENTDAIVNSTNSQLDLTQGDVSKAIVKAGGPMINHECSRLGGLTGGIAVTGAGNLPAKKIIHIEITPDPDNLKKVMKHCLQEAEKIGMSSIAFPALGTGRFTQMPEKMAAIMMECIANFCHSSQPKMLKLVRVTIFQKFMLDVFHQEMYKKAQQPKGFIQSKWDWIKGKLRTSGGGDQSEEMVHSQRKRFSGNRSPLSDRPTSSLSMPAHQRNMHMSIYGRSEINVQQTIEKIDEICDTETEEKIMGGPGSKKEAESIKKLTREQVNKIQSMDESHDVHIAITQSTKVNRIRVHGVSSDMLDIIDKIHDVFHEIDSEEWKKQHAEIIARNVHWEYLDGMKFKKYPDDINADIENACRAKQQTVEWTETGGRRYKIDFNTMKESVKGEYAPEVDVRRRDLADSTAPPDTWSNMPPDKVCLLVSLPNSSEEYNDVEQQFMLTIQGKCQHILQIERIQNPALYRSYEAHKQQMNEVNPSNVENERYLFHGTDAETLKKINTNGFNRSYCGKNATLYGKGVYFAKTSKYSHQYAKVDIDGKRTMYLCQVLTGEYTKAQEDMIDTPVKDAINHIKYDSAVDDPENPSIFVIFSDVKAYPTYLITYK